MDVTNVEIKELKANEKNPRKITKRELTKLMRSIEEFGFVDPVIVNKHKTRNNIVVGGHQRLKAAEKLGLKEVPVTYVDITEDKESLLNIALNEISGEWDDDKLFALLKELDNKGAELTMTGFDDDILLEMLKKDSLKVVDDEFVTVDAYERLKSKTKIKQGELFILGEHRVMCGNSTIKETVDKLMNEEKVDIVLTDPPYGIGYEYNEHKDTKGKEYLEFCDKWFENLKEISESIILFTGWSYKPYWYSKKPYDEMVWVMKGKHSGGKASHFRICEPIFVFGNLRNKYDFDWFETNNKKNFLGDTDLRELHTCPKPLSLISDLIIKQTDKEDIVLDIFGGSGTTLIVCEQIERKCRMMEIDPVYCAVIIERWEKLTGKKAIRESDGKTWGDIK